MKIKIASILFACAAGIALAFDPLSFGRYDEPKNSDEWLARILIDGFGSGDYWQDGLNFLAKELGNEKLGERIVEFMEPVFDDACASAYPEKKYVLCLSGIHALGYIRATNSIPFLERAVLHGSEDFSGTAFNACQMIMGYGDAYLDLLDRVLEANVITRADYATELTCFRNSMDAGRTPSTPKNKLAVAIRLVNNPYGYYLGGSENDRFLLANFPSYTNSVERLAALTAILENQLTPSKGHAKYGPERDRLKALPPEELICATDVLNAQLDALLKAAERKRKVEQVKKFALRSAAALLVLAATVLVLRRRATHEGKEL